MSQRLIGKIALVYWATQLWPIHNTWSSSPSKTGRSITCWASAPGGALTGQEFNPVDPADPNSERVPVTRLAGPITSVDPNHSLEAVNEQVFGVSVGQPDPAPMNGFVSSYIKNVGGDVTKGKAIMDCHAPESIPVLAGLAKNYRVCTRWFSSVPGQTWPNRFYMHAATSRGLVTNDPLDEDALTIFDKLDGLDTPGGSTPATSRRACRSSDWRRDSCWSASKLHRTGISIRWRSISTT